MYSVYGSPILGVLENELYGFRGYVCTGNDPQLLLRESKSGFKLNVLPGEYRILFHVQVSGGHLDNPKLYLDFGKGFSEQKDSTFYLEELSLGVWHCSFNVTRKAIAVRFDPSDAAVRFSVLRFLIWGRDVELTEMPRWRVRLLSRLRGLSVYKNPTLSRITQRLANALYSSEPLRDKHNAVHAAVLAELTHAQSHQVPVKDRVYVNAYLQTVNSAQGGRSPFYAPLRSSSVRLQKDATRVIAFYLPQFHPFPENDAWWGRGFTEWTNVGKATPQFVGHYQPRMPGELGYYDLRLKDVIQRQIELAKTYGVSGFCFHYYWFDGHRLLEKPLDLFLSEKGPEFSFEFCLCWANENWTRRWDGAEHDILMKQNHSEDDSRKVFSDLMRYISDPRYIKIDGKPVIIIYRPGIIPDVAAMGRIWREEADKAGLPGLFLVATTAFGFNSPQEIGFDALCMFPPHAVAVGEVNSNFEMLNPNFKGKIYDYGQTVQAFQNILSEKEETVQEKPTWPCVMTGWDNEARKPGRGHVFQGATPQKFYDWFSSAMDWSVRNHPPKERMVFVNAWNEWGEGTYLEPDRHFGYAFLQAIASKREEKSEYRESLVDFSRSLGATKKRRVDARSAAFIHIYYPDMADEFARALSEANQVEPMDSIVSIPDTFDLETARNIVEKLKPVRLVVCQNRGRDVWPFIESLRVAADLGYMFGCKLHTKKSSHLRTGDRWRRSLVSSLIEPAAIKEVLRAFNSNPRVALVAPEEAFMSTSHADVMRDNLINVNAILAKRDRVGIPIEDFVAGTMFWFRLSAFGPIANMSLSSEDFGPELGAIDGTLAHAFERLIPTLLKIDGFITARYVSTQVFAPHD